MYFLGVYFYAHIILFHIRVLHRYPLVTPPREDWEIEMENLQEKLDNMKREVLGYFLIILLQF